MDVANNDNNISSLHQSLVDQLKKEGHISTPSVEAAFRAVPRHLFLPNIPPEDVYRDLVIPTKFLHGSAISSSSQPTIMAIMLEQLQLQAGQRVLEIGAGTGYNAALLAHIVGDTGHVVTIDIDEDTVEGAREHLLAAGYERVQAVCSDGGLGYADAAPYDRIILTVGARDITPAWREQLKPAGRLVLPLMIRDPQVSVAFEQAQNHLVSVSLNACGFMTLRGAFAETSFYTQLSPEPALLLLLDECRPVDKEGIYQALHSPFQDIPTSIQVMTRDIYFRLVLWIALHDPRFCRLRAEGAMAERDLVPDLFGFSQGKSCNTFGLFDATNVCVLMRSPGGLSLVNEANALAPFELYVRRFGPDDTLSQRLIELLTTWDEAGRPGEERLHIKAYPQDTNYSPTENDIVIHKRWTQLVLNWE